MRRPFRVALVGCGVISDAALRHGYAPASDHATVVATVDSRIERANEAAAVVGARPHTSLAGALMVHDIDGVDIRVPHAGHATVALEAIAAGKHVLVEKPLAVTLVEADAMLDAAEAAGVVVAVNESYAFLEPVVAARHWISEGLIGDVVAARTQRITHLEDIWRRDGWRLDASRPDGGVLLDQGCHFTHVLRRALGEILTVQAMTSCRVPEFSAPDTALVQCRFADGLLGEQFYTYATRAPAPMAEATFLGTDGSLEVHPGYFGGPRGGLLHRTDTDPDGRWLTGGDYADSFRAAIVDWVAACLGEAASFMSGAEGRSDLAVVVAALESATSHQEARVTVRS